MTSSSSDPAVAVSVGTISRDGQPQPVAVSGNLCASLHDLLGPSAPSSIRAMLPTWADSLQTLDQAVSAGRGTWVSTESVTWLPPIPDPPTVYCCGANFYDHIEEMRAFDPSSRPPDKSSERVFHFTVSASSLVGHQADVYRPAGCEHLDWEVELAAVMRTTADDVTEQDALEYVAGYTVANDLSMRERSASHPIFGPRWLQGKGQRTMTPLGPTLVPAELIGDPQGLSLSLKVNGDVRQQSTTRQMIWTLAEQIADLSSMFALQPGDLILTGTPAGTAVGHGGGFLDDGDEMEATVEGVGTLTNRVQPRRQP
jgi:2-keto-4-pentenoate hydratase/2-oxohepta-3-ene-1,7-dioic acid hydratase in catechol pathway